MIMSVFSEEKIDFIFLEAIFTKWEMSESMPVVAGCLVTKTIKNR